MCLTLLSESFCVANFQRQQPLQMRACCERKRSANDVLCDPDNGRNYCGNCWHVWLQKNAKKAPSKSCHTPPASNPPATAPEACVDDEACFDDEQAGELVAVVAEGSEFFLTSRKLGLVFAPERRDGKLQRIGRLDGAGVVKLDDASKENGGREFPYESNPSDHCETPREAYVDIAPILEWLARGLGKKKEDLAIYDPYFCNGAVKRHLKSLGFPNVYNECEDFYALRAAETIPPYDVLVTNPPYAPTEELDHVEELLKHLCSQREQHPFFILQPNYVYTKHFYEAAVTGLRGGPRPFYLQPPLPRSYVYEAPSGLREVKSAQRKTAPFVTFWYSWLGKGLQAKFVKDWAARKVACPRLTLALSEYYLGDGYKDSSDKTRRRRGKKRSRDKS